MKIRQHNSTKQLYWFKLSVIFQLSLLEWKPDNAIQPCNHWQCSFNWATWNENQATQFHWLKLSVLFLYIYLEWKPDKTIQLGNYWLKLSLLFQLIYLKWKPDNAIQLGNSCLKLPVLFQLSYLEWKSDNAIQLGNHCLKLPVLFLLSYLEWKSDDVLQSSNYLAINVVKHLSLIWSEIHCIFGWINGLWTWFPEQGKSLSVLSLNAFSILFRNILWKARSFFTGQHSEFCIYTSLIPMKIHIIGYFSLVILFK